MSKQFEKLREVFLAAIARLPDEREAYLDEACGDDADLRREVTAMLEAHSADLGPLDREPMAPEKTDAFELPEDSSERNIGLYRLLQRIGEGGMGGVYMAEQSQPVQRRVALKIIKPGLDSRSILARFEAERQALAMMDHPNIAKVLDAGATATGRPYFVMELVKGRPITGYCDERRLTTRQRLELFAAVCRAVQHAHTKGIIHRDIKPSNVLVAEYDGRPVPKIIDFGVAKATGPKLTDRTLFTEFGMVVGTLEYMSPEQAELNQLDVDTRSDVYSLGVLLYELLAGSTPFSRKDLEKAGMLEMLRVIREQEPSKPSTKLSTADGLPTLAANRGTEPAKLTRLVRGELDWIVMKALEKDRSRRYETANGFAMDVERYLADEAVQACPPSAGYRLRKFVRRNHVAVATTGLAVMSLVAGLGGTTWGLMEARAAAASDRKSKETAETREAETRAVLEFVETKILAAARPEGQEGGLGHDVPLRRAIEAALPFVEKRFKDQPLIEGRLRLTMGASFYFLGDVPIAAEQYQAARNLFSERRGADDPEALSSMSGLARCYSSQRRFDEALKLREETLALRKTRLGEDHPDTLTSMHDLGSSYANVGRHDDAKKLREQTLRMRQAKLGTDHPDTLTSMETLSNSLLPPLGQHAEVLKLREEVLARRKIILGPDHPDTLRIMQYLVGSYSAVGRHSDALKLSEESQKVRKAKLGADHPDTLMSMLGVAYCHRVLGRYAEALRIDEEMLRLRKAKLGLNHAETIRSINYLAWTLATCPDPKLRDVRRAVELANQTIELAPRDSDNWNTLAMAQYRAADFAAAVSSLNKAIAQRRSDEGVDWLMLAMAHWQLGHKAEALDWYHRAVQWLDKNEEHDIALKEEIRRLRVEAESSLKIGGEAKAQEKR